MPTTTPGRGLVTGAEPAQRHAAARAPTADAFAKAQHGRAEPVVKGGPNQASCSRQRFRSNLTTIVQRSSRRCRLITQLLERVEKAFGKRPIGRTPADELRPQGDGRSDGKSVLVSRDLTRYHTMAGHRPGPRQRASDDWEPCCGPAGGLAMTAELGGCERAFASIRPVDAAAGRSWADGRLM